MLPVALGCALAIAVIWLGYPLLMVVVAALTRGRDVSRSPLLQPRVSVVIATLDSESIIRARVADVMHLDYPKEFVEVVVALDSQSNVVAESLADLGERVRVVRGGAPGGKAATLNAGVMASSGEILVFTDAAQRFDPSAVARLVFALGDEKFGAVSGALHIGRDGRPATLAERYWLFERWLRALEARVHSTVGVTGAVYAMRRSCWHPLPAGLILDDLYTPMQLVLRGYRVGFEPLALAFDERRFAPAQEFRRKVRTLTGVLQLCAWLPDVLKPWRNPIWAQFVFHKLLRLATPYLLLVLGVAFVAWSAATIGEVVPGQLIVISVGVVLAAVGLMVLNRRLRGALVMAAAMQAAVLRATVNGLRGRWDVWSR